MNQKQFDKLIEYIDASIKEALSHDTSDGGITESIVKLQLRDELELALVETNY